MTIMTSLDVFDDLRHAQDEMLRRNSHLEITFQDLRRCDV